MSTPIDYWNESISFRRFPEIRTFDMEDIANKLNNITLAGNAREVFILFYNLNVF